MKKKAKRYVGVLVLILLLLGVTVGYSILSQNLNITGTSHITAATFNVHFANVDVTDGSVQATTDPVATGTSTTEMNFEVDLEKPGDFYEFTFDVENTGSVDAKLSAVPVLDGVSTAQDVYINYTITHNDTNKTAVQQGEIISAQGGTSSFVVRVEFDKTIEKNQLPETPQTLDLSVAMNYVQP